MDNKGFLYFKGGNKKERDQAHTTANAVFDQERFREEERQALIQKETAILEEQIVRAESSILEHPEDFDTEFFKKILLGNQKNDLTEEAVLSRSIEEYAEKKSGLRILHNPNFYATFPENNLSDTEEMLEKIRDYREILRIRIADLPAMHKSKRDNREN
ncbi:MAG: hypothetical protein V4665_01740 [Patescibacteria group bacterium]